MRALSIKQPWAWCIVNGIKDIENRTWKTSYRGPVLIHASRQFDEGFDWKGFKWICEQQNIKRPLIQEFLKGYIIGQAELIDCVDSHPSSWFTGPWGFVLGSPKAFKDPIPYRGMLGIFNIPDRVVIGQ